MKQRPSSSRPYRAPSVVAPIAMAIAAGAAVGVGAVIASIAARVSLVAGDHAGASDQLALVTPLLCALAGGLLSVYLLHHCKVSDRDSLIAAAIAAAAPAFAFGHLARLFDPALALAAGGDGGRLSFGFWIDGCQWLESARAPDVLRNAPGLRPVSSAIGIEGCAALAMCELLLVAGLLLAAVDRALDAPLCTGCRRWCRRQATAIRRSARAPLGAVIERASMRDWRFFRELGPPRGRAAIRLDLAACPSCDRMSAISVSLSRPLRQDRTLVRDLRLGPDDLRTIRQMAAAQGPAASGAQAASPGRRAQTVAG
ncbi:MAG TPA: hypothetical protein VFU21_29610 [Kofleriaceae bacterium]|nr:hypothetical protein [Kofleriaceae bacterium]